MLCDSLEEWDGVLCGREVQEGGDRCSLRLIHTAVWQKPAQYCKAITLQLKGEGEGGMIWENGILTCILSCKN